MKLIAGLVAALVILEIASVFLLKGPSSSSKVDPTRDPIFDLAPARTGSVANHRINQAASWCRYWREMHQSAAEHYLRAVKPPSWWLCPSTRHRCPSRYLSSPVTHLWAKWTAARRRHLTGAPSGMG